MREQPHNTHNLIMEHFEVHKESLEDLIVDLNTKGPAVFEGLEASRPKKKAVTIDDLGLIDEISGLNSFLEETMQQLNFSETQKTKIRARMNVYNGIKPKEEALNEISIAMFGDNR